MKHRIIGIIWFMASCILTAFTTYFYEYLEVNTDWFDNKSRMILTYTVSVIPLLGVYFASLFMIIGGKPLNKIFE